VLEKEKLMLRKYRMNSKANRIWVFSASCLKLFNKKFACLVLIALYCNAVQAIDNNAATIDGMPDNTFAQATDAEGNAVTYPDIWFKEEKRSGEFLYPPAGDKRFELPNGLSDIVTLQHSFKAGEELTTNVIQTFFGNKIFKLKNFDHYKYIATLLSGEQIQFEGGYQPHSEYSHSPFDAPTDVTYTGADRQKKTVRVSIWLPDGSVIGTELIAQGYSCDPIGTAVVRLDSTRRLVWRWAMVALGSTESPKERKEDACFFVPQQRRISDPFFAPPVLLPDGTVLVDLHIMLVRIDANTGLAKRLPATVRIVDVDDLIAFTTALHNRIDEENSAQDYQGPHPMPYKAIPFTLMLQYFLFPNLLVSP
jgi:hypothetical protein